jgi:hypothetical protein
LAAMSERYLNIYEGSGVTKMHDSRKDADYAVGGAEAKRLACVMLTFNADGTVSYLSHVTPEAAQRIG